MKQVLEIEARSCKCGNTWTNSYTRHIGGAGLNVPGEVVSVFYFTGYPQSHTCFACVKPGLPVERYTPRKRTEPAPPLNLLD